MSQRRAEMGSLLALAIALGLAFGADALRARAHQGFQSAQRYEDIYYLPPPSALPWMTLGFDEAVADLIWIRALVYFGEELGERGAVEHVFDYADAILTLDPDFRRVYSWAGMAGLYRPNAVTLEEFEQAVAILERGADRFPDDGQLAWDTGAALIYEMASVTEDRELREAARLRGAPHLMRAARLGTGPSWAALSNAALLHNLGQDEQAARHLEEMYLSIDDPTTRQRIEARITELRSRTAARAFLEATRRSERDRQRDFPYVSPSLYQLLGPRHLDRTRTAMREGFGRAFADELE